MTTRRPSSVHSPDEPEYGPEWMVVPVPDNDIVVNSFFILLVLFVFLSLTLFFYRWMMGEVSLFKRTSS